MKKLYLFLILFIVLIVSFVFIFVRNNAYSYSLEKEEESVVNQYKLYVNKDNKHINGKVDITYLNNKKQTINVDKTGKLIIKSVIKKIENPRRR